MTTIDIHDDTSARIYWIGGSKGGVGKSMMTFAVLDYLVDRGDKALLVDCDTSNPDAWRAYREVVPTELVNLDEIDGWIHLVNSCEAHRGRIVVVNTAARNNMSVKRFGQTLCGSLNELRVKLVALWIINRQRDSLDLLKEFIDAMPMADVHVVRNGYFGEEGKFELYNTSGIRTIVESRGGKSLTLPNLADRVADAIYTKRLPISAAAKTMPIGNRAELGRWRGEARKVLAEVVS
jgi:hypothetical protein